VKDVDVSHVSPISLFRDGDWVAHSECRWVGRVTAARYQVQLKLTTGQVPLREGPSALCGGVSTLGTECR
jgi:hypothetical protein